MFGAAGRSPNRLKPPTQIAASANSDGAAVAVTEADFETAFQQPIIALNGGSILSSGNDVSKQLLRIHKMVCSADNWQQRIEGLKLLRVCVQKLLPQYYTDVFFAELNKMVGDLAECVEDSRFVIVREACITLAFLARETESLSESCDDDAQSLVVPKFERVACGVAPALLRAASKSTKCVSSCAVVALSFVVKFARTSKLVRLFCTAVIDKSSAYRKNVHQFVAVLLKKWNRREIGGEKNVGMIADVIVTGLNETDGDVRIFAQKALVEFYGLYPKETRILVLSKLNAEKRTAAENLIKNSVYGTSLAPPIATACCQPHVSVAADVENIASALAPAAVVNGDATGGAHESRPAVATTPKPFFTSGASITVPKSADNSRRLSAASLHQGSSSGGNWHDESSDTLDSTTVCGMNGIQSSTNNTTLRPPSSVKESNAPCDSPPDRHFISSQAAVYSSNLVAGEVKALLQELAKSEAENRKLKADEAARKVVVPKIRYTVVYDEGRQQVVFTLIACKNLPMVSTAADAVFYAGGDDNFVRGKAEPSAYAEIKLVNANVEAVASLPPTDVPHSRDESSNHLRVSRTDGANRAGRPRRSSSFHDVLSRLSPSWSTKSEYVHKTKTIKDNMNPYFAEVVPLSLSSVMLAEGNCYLSIVIKHRGAAGKMGREKKLVLGEARVTLAAQTVSTTEQPMVEMESELHVNRMY